jgi:glycopeptide antibiotics resistance protein
MTYIVRYFGGIFIIFVPLAVLGCTIIYIINRRGARRKTLRTPVRGKNLVDFILFINSTGFLCITLMPGFSAGRSVNLIPFAEVIQYYRYGEHISAPFIEIIGNILILVPSASLIGFRWPWADTLMRTMGCIAALVCSVEVLQYILGLGRVASVTDILLSMIGAIVGWSLRILIQNKISFINFYS